MRGERMGREDKIMATIEAVPNFSEGRDENLIKEITDAAAAVNGVKVLDVQSDSDHNRKEYEST